MEHNRKRTVALITVGSILIATLLVFATMWLGSNEKRDTDKAVRTVSLM